MKFWNHRRPGNRRCRLCTSQVDQCQLPQGQGSSRIPTETWPVQSRTQGRAHLSPVGDAQPLTSGPSQSLMRLGFPNSWRSTQVTAVTMLLLIHTTHTLCAANLSLLPLPALEKHLGEIREQTASASALLTYLLQSRDALQQDSETYNGLIAELVGEAQKIKTGKGRVVTRKGTIS